ncbi:hypothetical protein CcCBS67573_g01003 [Chytriomyces confervae]|uniref:Homeobox domain-containing protein n=1 Tax=Chytriomyces confervae TaxID=246404 RepID=A0A507FN85_9FUNG|nr:hypothetical protein HDU80_008546 [Chytriomyces hyalinus]TPX77764.1 hypothetical protein CcCBS67573_g01003 [Chytriomyces confervae]
MGSPATVDDISDATLAYLFDRRQSAPEGYQPLPLTNASFDRRMSLPAANFMLPPVQSLDYEALNLASDSNSAPSTPMMIGMFNQQSLGYNPKLFSTLPEFAPFPFQMYNPNPFTAAAPLPIASANVSPSDSVSLPTFEATSPNSPNSPKYAILSATSERTPLNGPHNNAQHSSPPQQHQHHNSTNNTFTAAATAASAPTKPGKFKPTESQLSLLVGLFEKNPFPSAALRSSLADTLGVQPKQIRFWFQNRRATYKINGIHVLKPKGKKAVSQDDCAPSLSSSSSMGKLSSGEEEAELDLEPVSMDNPFFYVEKGRRNSMSVVV